MQREATAINQIGERRARAVKVDKLAKTPTAILCLAQVTVMVDMADGITDLHVIQVAAAS